jgi:hypothetical protein
MEWKLTDSSETPKLITFESNANDQLVLYPYILIGGTSPGATVDMTFAQDDNSSGFSQELFPIGAFLYVDLIFNKRIAFGRFNVPIKVLSHNEGAQAEANPEKFTVNAIVYGPPPEPTFS